MIPKRSHLTFGLMVMRAGKACQTSPLLLIGQNNNRPVVCEAERRVVWRDGDTTPAASTSLNYRGDRWLKYRQWHKKNGGWYITTRWKPLLRFIIVIHLNTLTLNAALETGSSSKRSSWTQVRWMVNAYWCSMSILHITDVPGFSWCPRKPSYGHRAVHTCKYPSLPLAWLLNACSFSGTVRTCPRFSG